MIMIETRLLRLTPISWWYQGLGKWEQAIMNPVQTLSACSEQISPWEIITEINLVLPSSSKISLSCLPKTVSRSQRWHHIPVLRAPVRKLSLEMSKRRSWKLISSFLLDSRTDGSIAGEFFRGRGFGSSRVRLPLGSLCCYAVWCQMAPEYRGREQFINT